MNRILLADDSPHAQRMGERILREEGFEVFTVSDGDTALLRMPDIDPDLIIADVFLPQKSGYEICRSVKGNPRFEHIRVVLTAGLLEPIDDAEAARVQSDAILKKPFEASIVVETIRPLIQAAHYARGLFASEMEHSAGPVKVEGPEAAEVPAAAVMAPAAKDGAEIDPERVRAAIELALDAALPAMVEELTERVLVALGH